MLHFMAHIRTCSIPLYKQVVEVSMLHFVAHLRMLLWSLFFMGMAMYSSADILQNPDFESTPTNMTATTTNSTTVFLLIAGANTIPGWSYSGTVWYVSSSPNNYSLPGDGHGIRLGENGKINQTFRPNDSNMYYVVSFSLGAENGNCYNNSTAVNVSAPGVSKIFFLESNFFGRKLWESRAFYLGPWGGIDESINLEIKSVKIDAQPNVTCWPVVDTFVIQRYGAPMGFSDNKLVNSDLELGPAFIKNSSEGILLDDEPDQLESPLQQWSIIGTVKYIDSKHYSVPRGKAAVELISGAPSGISSDTMLTQGSKYTLEFLMGDANDSCVADFIVYAQIGKLIQNFTMRSSGKGSHQNFSMTFEAKTRLNPTNIISFNESRTSDNVLCGPVIDNVVLRPSESARANATLQCSYNFQPDLQLGHFTAGKIGFQVFTFLLLKQNVCAILKWPKH